MTSQRPSRSIAVLCIVLPTVIAVVAVSWIIYSDRDAAKLQDFREVVRAYLDDLAEEDLAAYMEISILQDELVARGLFANVLVPISEDWTEQSREDRNRPLIDLMRSHDGAGAAYYSTSAQERFLDVYGTQSFILAARELAAHPPWNEDAIDP